MVADMGQNVVSFDVIPILHRIVYHVALPLSLGMGEARDEKNLGVHIERQPLDAPGHK